MPGFIVIKRVSGVLSVGSLLGGLALPPPGDAATANTTMGVSATVVATCTVSASPMAFGNYTGLLAVSTATLTVQCSNTTSSTVGLGAGSSTGSTVTARKMTGAATVYLNYGLYQDAGYATNYGDTPALSPAPVVSTGAPTTITVYGRVLAGQFVGPGSYTDTVTATVNF